MLRQSGTTSIAAAASTASGLLLDVAIAARYGAGSSTDSFFAAARIPLGLVAIVMVGANQALVPAISTWLVKRGQQETWRLASILLCATLVLGGGIALLCAALAWPLMRITAPGFSPAEVTLAASLARIMFLVVPLVALAEILRAVLNAKHSFFAPAAMNVVMNSLAAGLILLATGVNVHVIAWAYAAGAAAQVVFMLVMAYRKGFRLHPSFAFRDAEVVGTGRLLVRPLIGASLNPVARIGEQVVVSFLPAGSITILNYGYRLVSAIGGTVLFRSVMVVVLPRLTKANANGDDKAFRSTTRLGIRILFVLSVAITVLMAILAKPAVLGLFQRGNFTHADAEMLGWVLVIYSASVIGSGLQRGMLAPFFGRLDTRTPLMNTAYGVAANLLLLPLFVLPLGIRDPEAVLGVAAAYSVAQYVNALHIWRELRRDLGIKQTGIAELILPVGFAAGVTAAVLLLGSWLLKLGQPQDRWYLLLCSAALGVLGLAVFVGVAGALHLPDIRRLRSDAAEGQDDPSEGAPSEEERSEE